MGLLDGKRIVITGVLTDASLAFGAAELALAEGAEILLTGAGRGMRLTQRTARKLGEDIEVVEFDVTEPSHADALRDHLSQSWGHVDGALHAIGFAPQVCLGGSFMEATWTDVQVALEISTYSLKMLADAVAPLMGEGGSIVGLDFDASRAWPGYDWMGVAKAGLESTCRYQAAVAEIDRKLTALIAHLNATAAVDDALAGRLTGPSVPDATGTSDDELG